MATGKGATVCKGSACPAFETCQGRCANEGNLRRAGFSPSATYEYHMGGH